MPTTVMATALPHSLAEDAPFHLSVFFTHKLTGDGAMLSDYPAALDWVSTLHACTLSLTVSSDPKHPLPLRVASVADSGAWTAVLPPTTPVAAFPEPSLAKATIRSNPASRLSDHAVDLHLAAITAAPTTRPGLSFNPVANALLHTLAEVDPDGSLQRLLDGAPDRLRRAQRVPADRLQDALTTIGPLTEPEWDVDGNPPSPPPYESETGDPPSPIEVLLSDPDADHRVTERLDALVGKNLTKKPVLQLIVDAHAMRRYYERPEQPQQEPRREPDPNAPPSPRPDRPDHDFHAKVASFGATPALLRRLGLVVDVVLDGMDAKEAQTALAKAKWVSVAVTSPDEDLVVLPPRRTSAVVAGEVFTARSTDAWVGGALPLGDDDWVILDTDPDASGLKLDQYTRTLARQYAGEANGDSATSAPGTLRSTGFALARRNRAKQFRGRLKRAEKLATDHASKQLLLDDLVRGIRVEVWDDVTRAWHSLHRRRVDVVADLGGKIVLEDTPDVGFLQLSALNYNPDDEAVGYYLHEVVAGWDGWSLSAPRPGLTIVHVSPPTSDGASEVVVDTPPDEPLDGAHVTTQVEPGSLPRLRYGTSYSFRVLAVNLAGNSVPQALWQIVAHPGPDDAVLKGVGEHLDRLRESYKVRDAHGVAAASREGVIEHLQSSGQRQGSPEVPEEMLSGNARIDNALRQLVSRSTDHDRPEPATQHLFDNVAAASRILAGARGTLRVRPQLGIDETSLAEVLTSRGFHVPSVPPKPKHPGFHVPGVPPKPKHPAVVTLPRPYLRWEPVPAPTLAPRRQLGPGEQPAHIVVRSGITAPVSATSERHIVPPKATQLEAETAGRFDAAIGTGDAAEIQRLYSVALAERGTLLDQFVPSLTDARATEEQLGIALVDRPGADTGSEHRATLADITAERGRPIGEGQYVIHDTDTLRLPYLPDPFAAGVSLVFWEAGDPHLLPEPRALQSVSVPYPGTWPSLRPLRIVVEAGDVLDASVEGHVVHVSLPPGVQVRAALSSTVEEASLDRFGLWRSHLASVADPADGYTTDEVAAAATLKRAAASGWTWWLTPSVDLRLVHAVPTPVRPPSLLELELFLRPPGRSVAAFSGLVDVHGSSTDTLLVRASWSEQVDDGTTGPQKVEKSDVVVRSSVGELERRGALFLFDYLPYGPFFGALREFGLHKMIQTFEDTHYRRVTYTPSGTSRFAEYFEPSQIPGDPPAGDPVVLDIPSSARPAAPVVLDAVPLLRWEEQAEPDDPFGWRSVRQSGARIWLARPWFSSGDGELLGVLLFDPYEWVKGKNGTWHIHPKEQQAPDGATSLWGADPIVTKGGSTTAPTVPPLLTPEHLLLATLEASADAIVGIQPPLHGEVAGGRDRGWPHTPGNPVAVAPAVPLRDVAGQPEVRVLGYQPEYDETSGRWFADVDLQETPALWPFVRLAVARYQPHSIEGCSLSPVALTSWVQPLPARTLTVTRPGPSRVQVTLTGVVNWLRSESSLVGTVLPGPGGHAARAAQLQQTRTVRATVQHRPDAAGDLEWETVASTLLPAGHVEESGLFRATWTGAVELPADGGTADGDATGLPGLRRPGGRESSWRVLVEEHELLDADSTDPDTETSTVPRLVYADEVFL